MVSPLKCPHEMLNLLKHFVDDTTKKKNETKEQFIFFFLFFFPTKNIDAVQFFLMLSDRIEIRSTIDISLVTKFVFFFHLNPICF